MKHTFSFPFFLFILLLAPFTVSGNLQKALALTPAADLTGDWSGFAQLVTTGDFSCTFSGNVNAHLEQNENSIDGNFSFVITDAQTTNPDAGYECYTFTEDDQVDGTIDGSRITLHSSDGGTFSGWYASSGIHLDLASPDYTGTAQLSPTGFTPPAFTPENEPTPPPPVEEQDSDGDGLVDSQDACPNDPAGTANGCPEKDTDGDGIPDSKDSCVNDPEDYFEGSADGCPEKDSDGDNIYDSIDQCPYDPEDTVGDIDGCPKQNTQEDQYAEPENSEEPKPSDWAEAGETTVSGNSEQILQNQKVGDLQVHKGSVTITTSDGKVVDSNELKIGQTIQTGQVDGTNIQIEIGNGATLNLKENTRVGTVGIISTDGKNIAITNIQDFDPDIIDADLTKSSPGLHDKPIDKETFTKLAAGAIAGGFIIGFFPALTAVAFGTAAIGTIALVGYTLYEGSVHFETTSYNNSDGKNQGNVIFTPNGAILHKGTEFTVIVENGITKMNVLDGEVYFVPYDNSPPTLITPGNSLTISDKKIEKTSLDVNSVDKWWEVSAQQSQQSKSGGCLIATATYGSELAPQVQFLREIRDNTVMSTASGASFMTAFNAFYYSFSPTVADWERENPVFKEMIKVTITPLLSSLSLLQYVDIDSDAQMLGYGIGIILLNIGMYFVAPTFLIVKLKRRFSKIHA